MISIENLVTRMVTGVVINGDTAFVEHTMHSTLLFSISVGKLPHT